MKGTDMPIYLAIDLGGTKTAVSVGDGSGAILAGERMPTEAEKSPAVWRTRLDALIQETLRKAGVTLPQITRVGLAVPGPMSVREGRVLAPPNMPAWRNVPVQAWVEELTGRPTSINNDANAAGLAEYLFGESRGVPDLVYLTMSTGIGAGVISGGQLVQGADDMGGEVGHMVLDPAGPPCPCGQRGCLEIFCGGRNLILAVQARLACTPSPLLVEESGGDTKNLTVSAIARAATRGDALATEFWQRFLDRLAQGVGIVVMTYNPRAIIMGTIAIHLGDLLLVPLRERLACYAWPQALRHLTIRPSALGTRIGDLGALAVAIAGESAARTKPHQENPS